jgi:hypothetical protein
MQQDPDRKGVHGDSEPQKKQLVKNSWAETHGGGSSSFLRFHIAP